MEDGSNPAEPIVFFESETLQPSVLGFSDTRISLLSSQSRF